MLEQRQCGRVDSSPRGSTWIHDPAVSFAASVVDSWPIGAYDMPVEPVPNVDAPVLLVPGPEPELEPTSTWPRVAGAARGAAPALVQPAMAPYCQRPCCLWIELEC
jgi:hypothetical protein